MLRLLICAAGMTLAGDSITEAFPANPLLSSVGMKPHKPGLGGIQRASREDRQDGRAQWRLASGASRRPNARGQGPISRRSSDSTRSGRRVEEVRLPAGGPPLGLAGAAPGGRGAEKADAVWTRS